MPSYDQNDHNNNSCTTSKTRQTHGRGSCGARNANKYACSSKKPISTTGCKTNCEKNTSSLKIKRFCDLKMGEKVGLSVPVRTDDNFIHVSLIPDNATDPLKQEGKNKWYGGMCDDEYLAWLNRSLCSKVLEVEEDEGYKDGGTKVLAVAGDKTCSLQTLSEYPDVSADDSLTVTEETGENGKKTYKLSVNTDLCGDVAEIEQGSGTKQGGVKALTLNDDDTCSLEKLSEYPSLTAGDSVNITKTTDASGKINYELSVDTDLCSKIAEIDKGTDTKQGAVQVLTLNADESCTLETMAGYPSVSSGSGVSVAEVIGADGAIEYKLSVAEAAGFCSEYAGMENDRIIRQGGIDALFDNGDGTCSKTILAEYPNFSTDGTVNIYASVTEGGALNYEFSVDAVSAPDDQYVESYESHASRLLYPNGSTTFQRTNMKIGASMDVDLSYLLRKAWSSDLKADKITTTENVGAGVWDVHSVAIWTNADLLALGMRPTDNAVDLRLASSALIGTGPGVSQAFAGFIVRGLWEERFKVNTLKTYEDDSDTIFFVSSFPLNASGGIEIDFTAFIRDMAGKSAQCTWRADVRGSERMVFN